MARRSRRAARRGRAHPRPSPVTSTIGVEREPRPAQSTEPSTTRSPDDDRREPTKQSSRLDRPLCGGSSTPPMPTPPKVQAAADWAHDPTVAHVSTIVPSPRAPEVDVTRQRITPGSRWLHIAARPAADAHAGPREAVLRDFRGLERPDLTSTTCEAEVERDRLLDHRAHPRAPGTPRRAAPASSSRSRLTAPPAPRGRREAKAPWRRDDGDASGARGESASTASGVHRGIGSARSQPGIACEASSVGTSAQAHEPAPRRQVERAWRPRRPQRLRERDVVAAGTLIQR